LEGVCAEVYGSWGGVAGGGFGAGFGGRSGNESRGEQGEEDFCYGGVRREGRMEASSS